LPPTERSRAMCYEFDSFFGRARLAEQLRLNKERAAERAKQRKTATPATPAEPERPIKEQEPVSA
jgi:hypothetical protein